MLEPIVKTVDVPCGAEQAFAVFVDKISTWWPLDKNSVSAMNEAVAKQVVIEPKLGGEVYEIGHDDTKHSWGSVTAYEPGKRLVLDWHIGLPSSSASEVEVLFDESAGDKTRVTLSHSRWEAFGEKANDMRNGYDKGWVGVFEEAYVSAFT